MRVAWFSAGCSSFVAAYYGKPDRIVYIDVANQHPDSMRFLRDAERVLGREIGHSCIKGVFPDELDPNRGNMRTEVMPSCGFACEALEVVE